MSEDRETSHEMTHRDIALLLADAADEVEIGIAPYQQVVRGGRRRRARRYLVATAVAVVIAGSTGTLALAGGFGGDGGRVATTANRPPTAEQRHVYAPQRTTLAYGTDHGKEWRVTIDVWGTARNDVEAQGQLEALGEFGNRGESGAKTASDLIGRHLFFVHLILGDEQWTKTWGEFTKGDTDSGTDLQSVALPLQSNKTATDDSDQRLVIGRVARTAHQVTCTWKDGTSQTAPLAPRNRGFTRDFQPYIRPAGGSPSNWFVCLAPEGKTYEKTEVTK
ncbi:hypothetical protein [Streptomyces sp. NPDC005485]|uniref:hypothetical protein n=1 Tax=Streptomyces sp. NPDC005485 TaxID=3155591 RepID=UPI0033B1A3D5